MANRAANESRTDEFDKQRKDARNEDPMTGQPGAHPAGVGVGAAAGGALAGAAAGAVAGPIGAAVGAVVGGVGGGLAGKAVAEQINPTEELNYWRDNYRTRDYYQQGKPFENYETAYRYGIENSTRYDVDYDAAESRLQSGWNSPNLEWKHASPAVRDAYERARRNRRREVSE